MILYEHQTNTILALGILTLLGFLFSVGSDEPNTDNAGLCEAKPQCPVDCDCEDTVVDCSGRKLTVIPEDIPEYTTELWV